MSAKSGANRARCLAAASLLVSAAACALACGARSTLRACTDPGVSRACEDTCGAGSQVCIDGQWGTCVVAPMTRGCSNACGTGEQTCAGGGDWSECDVPVAVRPCTGPCGSGEEQCARGAWSGCDAAVPGPPTFAATVRDFADANPDFETDGGRPGLELGIVAPDLGPDDKPVFAGGAVDTSTHGVAYFDEWYRDTPGVNLSAPLSLSLASSVTDPTVYAYQNGAFFPIDNRLLGNQGRPHNYGFTVEFAANFRYHGGETFRFGSDDDSFIFLNRRLAVDLGGRHDTLYRSVNLDTARQTLGMTVGQIYPMHLFYAERHVVGAALYVDVSAADFAVCSDGSVP